METHSRHDRIKRQTNLPIGELFQEDLESLIKNWHDWFCNQNKQSAVNIEILSEVKEKRRNWVRDIQHIPINYLNHNKHKKKNKELICQKHKN